MSTWSDKHKKPDAAGGAKPAGVPKPEEPEALLLTDIHHATIGIVCFFGKQPDDNVVSLLTKYQTFNTEPRQIQYSYKGHFPGFVE